MQPKEVSSSACRLRTYLSAVLYSYDLWQAAGQSVDLYRKLERHGITGNRASVSDRSGIRLTGNTAVDSDRCSDFAWTII